LACQQARLKGKRDRSRPLEGRVADLGSNVLKLRVVSRAIAGGIKEERGYMHAGGRKHRSSLGLKSRQHFHSRSARVRGSGGWGSGMKETDDKGFPLTQDKSETTPSAKPKNWRGGTVGRGRGGGCVVGGCHRKLPHSSISKSLRSGSVPRPNSSGGVKIGRSREKQKSGDDPH